MTRLSPRTLRQSFRLSPLLPQLVLALRSFEQARQEFRWIQNELPSGQWNRAILRRANHEPLQYILGTQPFGELEIRCRPNVLIPRWETEEWVSRLCEALEEKTDLKILDACTGTGCIPLLMYHKLRCGTPDISAFDISIDALDLCEENLRYYRGTIDQCDIKFFQQDIFAMSASKLQHYDIVISNPPYVLEEDYYSAQGGVEPSVRKFEPALALIGNTEFYKALIEQLVLPTDSNAFVFELGYRHQAEYVCSLLDPSQWSCGVLHDSQDHIRCVVGWKRASVFNLTTLCNETYF